MSSLLDLAPANATLANISRIERAPEPKRGRVRRTFRVFDVEGSSRLVIVIGRDAWMLGNLVNAGTDGCTTLSHPAPRTSHYVWKLRHTYGIAIASIEEEHGGIFAGRHVRYTLQQRVEFADDGEAA